MVDRYSNQAGDRAPQAKELEMLGDILAWRGFSAEADGQVAEKLGGVVKSNPAVKRKGLSDQGLS